MVNCDDCGAPAVGTFDIIYLKANGEQESVTKGRPLCERDAKLRKVL